MLSVIYFAHERPELCHDPTEIQNRNLVAFSSSYPTLPYILHLPAHCVQYKNKQRRPFLHSLFILHPIFESPLYTWLCAWC